MFMCVWSTRTHVRTSEQEGGLKGFSSPCPAYLYVYKHINMHIKPPTHLVDGADDGAPRLRELADDLDDDHGGAGVKAAGRLVEENERGAAR